MNDLKVCSNLFAQTYFFFPLFFPFLGILLWFVDSFQEVSRCACAITLGSEITLPANTPAGDTYFGYVNYSFDVTRVLL